MTAANGLSQFGDQASAGGRAPACSTGRNDPDSRPAEAAEVILRRLGSSGEDAGLKTAVVLGSGLGAVGDQLQELGGTAVSFADIPHFPTPSIEGHAGRMIFGAGRFQRSVVLQGRVHYYEGHELPSVTFAIRVLAYLGIQRLILTNAAGGVRDGMSAGDLMLIEGHWTFLNVSSPAPRETASVYRSRYQISDGIWNRGLLQLAGRVPTPLKIHRGVYAMMSGPNYETPAEVRMLQRLGVDAVGMSTVPEALAAGHLGMKVLGVSCITNIASGLTPDRLSHQDVSKTAQRVQEPFSEWMLNLLATVSESDQDANDC